MPSCPIPFPYTDVLPRSDGLLASSCLPFPASSSVAPRSSDARVFVVISIRRTGPPSACRTGARRRPHRRPLHHDLWTDLCFLQQSASDMQKVIDAVVRNITTSVLKTLAATRPTSSLFSINARRRHHHRWANLASNGDSRQWRVRGIMHESSASPTAPSDARFVGPAARLTAALGCCSPSRQPLRRHGP